MRKYTLLFIAISISTLLLNCKSEEKLVDFTALTKSYFDGKNELNPLDATLNGQSQFNDQLQFEMTDSFRLKQKAFYDKFETELSKVDETKLSSEEKISYEIIKWEIGVGKELLAQPSNLIPIHQFWGTHLTMGQYAGGTAGQPFKTEKDYRNFLKRMDLYSVWIDSAMVYMKKGIAKGAVLPKALTLKIIPEFEDMITSKVEDNLFYSTIKTMPTSFSDTVKKDLTDEYKTTISNKLIPQFQKMTQFLKSEYLPASRNTSGIGSLPYGKEYYAACVKQWTTTNTSPEEIHELGLKEVTRIKLEMEKVKTEVGYKGTLLSFFDEVRNKKELKPFKKPEEVIANFESIFCLLSSLSATALVIVPETIPLCCSTKETNPEAIKCKIGARPFFVNNEIKADAIKDVI